MTDLEHQRSADVYNIYRPAFLFFSQAPYVNKTPAENIDYYKKETPAQSVSFQINRVLESNLSFLDKEEYSLNALLAATGIPNRPDVYELPDFPAGFTAVTFDRQSYMTDKFVNDTNQVKQVRMVWGMLGKMAEKMPPITEADIDNVINSVKKSCDAIRARGGQVTFVRTPSSGPLWAMEQMAFPRQKFWNKLLTVTGCEGIHFQDYPQVSTFECPEFSHLSVPQAISFTKAFVEILKDKGWRFPNTNATKSINPKI